MPNAAEIMRQILQQRKRQDNDAARRAAAEREQREFRQREEAIKREAVKSGHKELIRLGDELLDTTGVVQELEQTREVLQAEFPALNPVVTRYEDRTPVYEGLIKPTIKLTWGHQIRKVVWHSYGLEGSAPSYQYETVEVGVKISGICRFSQEDYETQEQGFFADKKSLVVQLVGVNNLDNAPGSVTHYPDLQDRQELSRVIGQMVGYAFNNAGRLNEW